MTLVDENYIKSILDDISSKYSNSSTKASDVARSCAFGAAALCWSFKTNEAQFPILIIISLLFIVIYFAFDWLQYYLASMELKNYLSILCNQSWNLSGFKKAMSNREKNINKALMFKFFHMKFFMLFISYVCIIFQIVVRLSISA